MNKQIILASKSPRRIQLLKELNIKFTVDPSDFEEKDSHLTPEELAIHNAQGKAESKIKKYKNALIIGVDTVVAVGEHMLGKPKDKEDAKRILRLLSGSKHRVISAITVIDTETQRTITETSATNVEMDELTEEEMDAYIASGEGIDKAAGYAIQGKGSLFIRKIDGDYFNVVGLPIYTLRKILMNFGLDIM